MEFDERRLHAVVVIADTGSLSRAAEALHVSQPALSRMIGDLEARLDTRLFERHAKGMVLTEAGSILAEHARQLTFDIQQARHALQELKGLRAGSVRVGAVAAATRTLIPHAIMALREKAPGLTVDLIEAPDSELIDALLERRIDVIVASDTIAHTEIEPLDYCSYEDSFHVCCRAANPPVGDSPSLRDVFACSWVMLKRGRTPRSRFEQLAATSGCPLPRVAVETNSVGAQIGIIRQTDLLGWLPEALIADHLAAGDLKLVPVPEIAEHRRFRAYRRHRGFFSPQAEMFLACLGV